MKAYINFSKYIEKMRKELENKIDQDNKKIRKFFEDSFGKPADEIDPEVIKETYLYKNPKITTEDRVLKGWDKIKSHLSEIPEGTSCGSDDENVDVNLDYLSVKDPEDKVKNDFDLHAHVKTAFNFGGTKAGAGSDPDGEGDLKHRRICVWEP